MAKIGEFGRARQDLAGEPDTFTFYGEDFEVPAGISAVVLMDFVAETQDAQDGREDAGARQERAQAALARSRMTGSESERVTAEAALADADVDMIAASNKLMRGMRAYVRGCLPDDVAWRRFNDVCRANAVDVDELMEVAAAIFAAVAARPTRTASGSSGGPSSTGVGSTAGAASQAATPGLPPPATASPDLMVEPGAGTADDPAWGRVVSMHPEPVLTPLERQLQEGLAHSVPVSHLLSGG
jgi:hypothetical protein